MFLDIALDMMSARAQQPLLLIAHLPLTPALSCVGPRRGGLPIPLCPLAEDLLPPGGRNPVLFLALGTSVRMGIT